MTVKNNRLLDRRQIFQKAKRIAYQIYEENFLESELIFAGIEGTGYLFAEMLQTHFSQISAIPSKLVRVNIDKLNPAQSEVKLDCTVEELENKTIVLVDDVLYTGKTMAYSLKPFLKANIKKIQVAVVVDRSHKNFPIAVNYVGYALSTTLNEYIKVVLDDDESFGVYIS